MNIALIEFKNELTVILKAFDEIMHAKFGNTVTIHSDKGIYTRPSTKQDEIDAIKYEWDDTVMRLSEMGIDLEEANQAD